MARSEDSPTTNHHSPERESSDSGSDRVETTAGSESGADRGAVSEGSEPRTPPAGSRRALGAAPERPQLGSGSSSALPSTYEPTQHDDSEQALAFLEGRELSATALRELLRDGSRDERAWAVSQLLRHAPWSQIWRYVDRPQVRDLWDDLDLPDSLREAWGRQLGL